MIFVPKPKKLLFKIEKRKHEDRAEEARRENERNMVQSALGDKKAKMGVSFLYDMPNNIMPKGNLFITFSGLKILTEHIEMKNSLDFKLYFESICSIRIRTKTQDITNKKLQISMRPRIRVICRV